MKNFLFNNYNIKIDKIYFDGVNKYCYVGNEKLYIIESNYDKKQLDDLFELTNRMYNSGIMVNTFILNNSGKPYTERDKINIIILKSNNIINDININDFNKYQDISNNLKLYNILDEWKDEVDVIEKEMIEYNKEYPLIQNSLDYFIGMAENSIELIYEIKNDINRLSNTIGHKVTYELYNKCILEDPFTFIRVNRMYDISNYVKYKFYKNELDYDEIDNYINNINEAEIIYLFSCLLYPNTYFDLVKEILLEKEEENKINIYIKRIKDYERLLEYFKDKYKSVKVIDLINWICR